MSQGPGNRKASDSIPHPKEGFFDMRLSLLGWADVADDYKIIAELIPKCRETSEAIDILSEVNENLPPDSKYIFDGTISSLNYLRETGLLEINDIKNRILKELITKYSNTAIDQSETMKMNRNRWSGQALRCKAVLIGLYLKRGKLKFNRGLSIVEDFRSLNENDFPVLDDDIKNGAIPEESVKRLTNLNATWSALTGMVPWNNGKSSTPGEFMMGRMVESYMVNTDMNLIFDKIQPILDSIAVRYFPGFHTQDHTACVATRHAATIVLHHILEGIPKDAVRHPRLRVDGFLNKWIEYIFTEDYELQGWFTEYLKKEMEPRIKFIKMLVDTKTFIKFDPEIDRFLQENLHQKFLAERGVFYLPVFESFRLVPPGALDTLNRLVVIFHNQEIPTVEKEEIAKNIVSNTQKLVLSKRSQRHPPDRTDRDENKVEEGENILREAFILLILNILDPLIKSIVRRHATSKTRLKDGLEELKQLATVKTIDTVLRYDPSINPSFFGYIKTCLPLNTWSEIRERKSEILSTPIEQIESSNLESLSVDSMLYEVAQVEEIRRRVSECLNQLPEKEGEAIRKTLAEKKLTATERKAKNRAIQRLRAKHPELRNLLG